MQSSLDASNSLGAATTTLAVPDPNNSPGIPTPTSVMRKTVLANARSDKLLRSSTSSIGRGTRLEPLTASMRARQTSTVRLIESYRSDYKRRMLNEMRGRMASAIPNRPGEVRLGGQRTLPSYESERLMGLMERGAWQWPGESRLPAPRRISTGAFVDNVGRLDPLQRYGGSNAHRRAEPSLSPSVSLPAIRPKQMAM